MVRRDARDSGFGELHLIGLTWEEKGVHPGLWGEYPSRVGMESKNEP